MCLGDLLETLIHLGLFCLVDVSFFHVLRQPFFPFLSKSGVIKLLLAGDGADGADAVTDAGAAGAAEADAADAGVAGACAAAADADESRACIATAPLCV